MLFNLLYIAALALLSPVIVYRMIRYGRYRRGAGEKLRGLSLVRAEQIRGDHSACVWIHAVSVGEVNLLPTLVQRIQAQCPDMAVAISTSTDTGYDLATKLFGQNRVFFCPLDFTWAVKRTLRHLKPDQVVLTELELWPNLIRLAGQRDFDDEMPPMVGSVSRFGASHGSRRLTATTGASAQTAKRSGAVQPASETECPVRIINGRMSSNSAANYQRFARFIRPTFTRFDWVGAQDQEILSRFSECGVPADRITVTGSIKFDNAPQSRETPEVMQLAAWAGVDPWHRVWIVGSTQEGEEAMALAIYDRIRDQYPELRLVLVPRHVERFDTVDELIQQKGFQSHRRSRDESLSRSSWTPDHVILVDTIGELRHWWGVGQIATVGGSFGNRGGQNMLEPAGYGSAVSFGPHTKNFRTIADRLVAADAAVRVADEAELESFVRRSLENIPAADALGRAAREVVAQHRGAIDRTLAALITACDNRSRAVSCEPVQRGRPAIQSGLPLP